MDKYPASSPSAALILVYLPAILLEGVRTRQRNCALAFSAIWCSPGTSVLQKCFCGLFPDTWLWQSHLHSGYFPHALCSLTIFLFPCSFASSPFLLQHFPVPRSRARCWLLCCLFLCLQPSPSLCSFQQPPLLPLAALCSHRGPVHITAGDSQGLGGPTNEQKPKLQHLGTALGWHHRVCTFLSPSQVHYKFLCAPGVSVLEQELLCPALSRCSIWQFVFTRHTRAGEGCVSWFLWQVSIHHLLDWKNIFFT